MVVLLQAALLLKLNLIFVYLSWIHFKQVIGKLIHYWNLKNLVIEREEVSVQTIFSEKIGWFICLQFSYVRNIEV